MALKRSRFLNNQICTPGPGHPSKLVVVALVAFVAWILGDLAEHSHPHPYVLFLFFFLSLSLSLSLHISEYIYIYSTLIAASFGTKINHMSLHLGGSNMSGLPEGNCGSCARSSPGTCKIYKVV